MECSVLTKIIYLVIFAGIAANFFKFQYMCTLAIRSDKQQETVSMPKYSLKYQNWTIIFEIQF